MPLGLGIDGPLTYVSLILLVAGSQALCEPYRWIPFACFVSGVSNSLMDLMLGSRTPGGGLAWIAAAVVGVGAGFLVTRLREGKWFPPRSGFWGKVVTTPVAGWYPDQTAALQLRYWDGTAWTGHVHPTVDDVVA